MTSAYRAFEELRSRQDLEGLAVDSFLERVSQETVQITRKMAVLPTQKEAEALPELRLLRDVAENLFKHLGPSLHDHEKLERFLAVECFSVVVSQVIKAKIYNDKEILNVAHALFGHLVSWVGSLVSSERLHLFHLLNTIVDKGADYYRTNSKETLSTQPFGEPRVPDPINVKFVDELSEGDLIDVLKSSNGHRNWTRGTVVTKDYNFFKVRMHGESSDAYVQQKYFEIYPPKSFSADFEWREGLKVGDRVDYDANTFRSLWKLCEVVEIRSNEAISGPPVKTAMLVEINPETGEKINDIYSETIYARIHSPSLARPGSRSIKSTTNFDDSDDWVFLCGEKKPRYAIMRNFSQNQISCNYLVHYINLFGEQGGFASLIKGLEAKENIEVLSAWIRFVQSAVDYLIEPFVSKNGLRIFEFIKNFGLENTEKNLRNFSVQNITAISDSITSLSQRIFRAERAKKESKNVSLRVAFLCLKSDFVQKQNFGAKVLEAACQKASLGESSFTKKELSQLIFEENLFEKIIKGHPSLISKSSSIFRLLFVEKKVSSQQFDLLWEQIFKADLESKKALITVLKDVIYDLTEDEIKSILSKVSWNIESIGEPEIELVVSIKNKKTLFSSENEVSKNINDIFWKMLQRKTPMKKEFLKEIQKDFVKSMENASSIFYENIIGQIRDGQSYLLNLKLLRLLLRDHKTTNEAAKSVRKNEIVSKVVDNFVCELEKIAIETYTPEKQAQAQSPEFFNEEPVNSIPPLRKKYVSQVLKFLDTLLYCNREVDVLLPFEAFERIWSVVYRHCILASEVTSFLENFINNEDQIHHSDSFLSFFHSNIGGLDRPYRNEFFVLFVHVFCAVNIERKNITRREVRVDPGYSMYPQPAPSPSRGKTFNVLRVPAESLEGFSEVWTLYFSCDSPGLEAQVASMLANIVSPGEPCEGGLCENAELYSLERRRMVDKCLSLLDSEDLRAVGKAAGLLEKLIRKEECLGGVGLPSFASLKPGERITVNFERKSRHRSERGERGKATLSESSTLVDLTLKVSTELRLPVEAISLSKNGKVFSSLCMPSTLEQAGVGNNDTLQVTELAVAEKPMVPLLDEKGDFTSNVLSVFKEVFNKFAPDGKMTAENLADMTSKATDNSQCTADDERVVSVMQRYDLQSKGWLSYSEFLKFYREAASTSESKSTTVRKNLASLGYDLALRPRTTIAASTRVQLVEAAPLFSRLFARLNCAPPCHAVDNLRSLLEFLTPCAGLIEEMLADPAAALSTDQGEFARFYRLTVAYWAATQPDAVAAVFAAAGRSSPPLADTALGAGLASEGWVLAGLRQTPPRSARETAAFFRLVRLVFFSLLVESHPEFIADSARFSFYFNAARLRQQKRTPARAAQPRVDADRDDSTPDDRALQRLAAAARPRAADFLRAMNFAELNSALAREARRLVSEASRELTKPAKESVLALIGLLCASNLLSPRDFEPMLAQDSPLMDVMIEALLSNSIVIRLNFRSLYAFFSVNNSGIEAKKSLLSRLITCIKTQSNSRIHNPIDVASYLLTEVAESKNDNLDLHSFFKLPSLFADFAGKLSAMEVNEFYFDDREDHNLNAVLSILEKILIADPSVLEELDPQLKIELSRFLFEDCLFKLQNGKVDSSAAKCKVRKSRDAAMGLLASLARNDSVLVVRMLERGFAPLSRAFPDFSRAPPFFLGSDQRGEVGFLGIKNLGCICYMIAMLQQFYCTPTFRYGLLMAEDHKEVELSKVKTRTIDDNVFHQLQKMFANLDLSKRADFNPTEFCLSYKDYGGEPINWLVQQDAQEFLNMIFDKLDNSLKNTPFKGFLESVFGGQTANVFTCKVCNFSKQNIELFFNLSLEVKHCANITESFEKMISEEIISEYLCSNCKNKCDVGKRCFLKTLPNVLIVHLQKIVFDIDALVNVKLSNRYEFPQNINLKKFVAPDEPLGKTEPDEEESEENNSTDRDTQETKTETQKESKDLNDLTESTEPKDTNEQTEQKEVKDEEFEYKLVGVVIHRGNAENGHYTSLINVNRGDPNRKNLTGDLWLDFDDSRVSIFDMAHFEEDCFGAQEEKDFGMMMETSISKSAYILVYDKVKKNNIKMKFTPENVAEKSKIVSNLIDPKAFTWNEPTLEFETNFYNINTYIPPQYKVQIEEDNDSAILEGQILNKQFTGCLSRILFSAELPRVRLEDREVPSITPEQQNLARKIIETLPEYLVGSFPYAEESPEFASIIERLESSIILCREEILPFFIHKVYLKVETLVGLLMNGVSFSIRQMVSDFLASVVVVLCRAFEFSSLDEAEADEDAMKAFGVLPGEPSAPFSEAQRKEAAPLVAKMILRRFLDGFIGTLSSASPATAKKLGFYFAFMHRISVNSSVVANYLIQNNFLTLAYNIYTGIENTRSYSDKFLGSIILLISALLKQLREERVLYPENEQYVIYYNYFVRSELIERVLREEFSLRGPVEEFVRVVSIEDKSATDSVVSVALRQLDREHELAPTFYTLLALLKIKDSLREYRFHRILGVPRLEGELSRDEIFVYGPDNTFRSGGRDYSFPSLYLSERGLLDLLPDFSQSKFAMVVTYLMDLAGREPDLLEYLCQMPAGSVRAKNVFEDWPDQLRNYISVGHSAETAKFELKIAMDMAPEAAERFVARVTQAAERKGRTAEQRIFSTVPFPYEKAERADFGFRNTRAISKTLGSRLLFRAFTDEAESGPRVEGYIDKVESSGFDGKNSVSESVFRISAFGSTQERWLAKLRIVHLVADRRDTYDIVVEVVDSALFTLEGDWAAPKGESVQVLGTFAKVESGFRHSRLERIDESIFLPFRTLFELNNTN